MARFKVKWNFPARQGIVFVDATDEDEAIDKAYPSADCKWAEALDYYVEQTSISNNQKGGGT
ncbi:MAG: hypothetical protein JKY17_06525 [Magnetovibrio sp.]|nr:hypothetical protein [Magnetovibrio sp.]